MFRMTPLPEEIRLAEILRSCAPLGIAFSGGADSTALAVFAAEHLKPGEVLLIHVSTPLVPGREGALVREIAEAWSIPLKIVHVDVLADPSVRANDSMRCYHCKKLLMTESLRALREAGFATLCDGANTDDNSDWRPGMKAAAELGVRHPFLEAGLGKRRIRLIARRLGIAGWMMPPSACAASRFPCGTPLNEKEIERVVKAERLLAERFHVPDVRVRCLAGRNASIEVKGIQLRRILRLEPEIRKHLLTLGFHAVTIAPGGYRRGAMNRVPPQDAAGAADHPEPDS